MAIHQFANFTVMGPDGRVLGHYVYMLLCQDEGPIYVKVGISKDPTERFKDLHNACPVKPRQLLYCRVSSEQRARFVERELHAALKAFRAHGEWFTLRVEQRTEFNAAWSGVFRTISEPGHPMRWSQLAAQPLVRRFKHLQAAHRRKFSAKHRAVRDAINAAAR